MTKLNSETTGVEKPAEEVKEPVVAKILVVVRSVSTLMAGAAICAPLLALIEHLIPALNAEVRIWLKYSLALCLFLGIGAHFLLQLAVNRYQEKDFSPVERTSRQIKTIRDKHVQALADGSFESLGLYRVHGSAFSTQVEFYLGCEGMVVAELLSISGTPGIELTSMLENGFCIATCSIGETTEQPVEQRSEYMYAATLKKFDFAYLLHQHLQTANQFAEEQDSCIDIIQGDEFLDLAKYSNRVFHDLLYKTGKIRHAVTAHSYGRFRFPPERHPIAGDDSTRPQIEKTPAAV